MTSYSSSHCTQF